MPQDEARPRIWGVFNSEVVINFKIQKIYKNIQKIQKIYKKIQKNTKKTKTKTFFCIKDHLV
mgnify:CR=1 FL=1